MNDLQFTNLRIPSFVKEDYPLFTQFIRYYYEWLSQNGAGIELDKLRDIDTTIDVFVEALQTEYVKDFPKTFKGDVRQLLKHNLEFYKSKGSEESMRFLFRVLFNAEIDIQYPRDFIFTTSEGTWNAQKSIKIQTSDIRINEAIGQRIFGETSKSLAYIENVYQYSSLGVQVAELFLSDIKGAFQSENVSITLPDGHIITGNTVTAITAFTVVNGGLGYKTGQTGSVVGGDLQCTVGEVARGGIDGVVIVNGGLNYTLNSVITLVDPTGKGIDAELKITSVDINGTITGIDIIKRGNGYEDYPLINITIGSGAILTLQSNSIGKIKSISIENHGVYTGGLPTVSFATHGDGNAVVTPVKGILCTYTGKYESVKSFVSDINKIQDGVKYQPYSYVIRSGQSVSQYKDILKKLVHPAGMLQLGEMFIEEKVVRTVRNINTIGLYGGSMLREIVSLHESLVQSASSNLNLVKDVVLIEEVSYRIPSKSNVMNVVDWNYKFNFTSRQIKGFLNEPISNYTFTSDRVFATVGKAVVGTITVGYDKIKQHIPLENQFIELGNAGRGVAGFGVVGVAMSGSLTGRKNLADKWGDVIADVTKTNIVPDAEISILNVIYWDGGATIWDGGTTIWG